MDFSVREWMLIVGGLLVLAVLLDGLRRMRNEQRNRLRVAVRDKHRDEDDLLNPELPGGGARVVAVRQEAEAHNPALQRKEPRFDSDLNLEQDVPVLMEPVDDELPEELEIDAGYDETGGEHETDEPWLSAAEEVDESFDDDELGKPRARVAAEPIPGSRTLPSGARQETAKETPRPLARDENTRSGSAPFQELLVLHVVARGQPLKGHDLLQILLACDVRFGRMGIFHRYEQGNGTGAEQFSVANMVKPGTFDLDNIDGFSTPGVTFFMQLPGPQDAAKAFDCMVETARCLVKNLDCELLDETRSVATTQTIEHYRQRVRDFERRQLTLV